jgi:hypothetical protein
VSGIAASDTAAVGVGTLYATQRCCSLLQVNERDKSAEHVTVRVKVQVHQAVVVVAAAQSSSTYGMDQSATARGSSRSRGSSMHVRCLSQTTLLTATMQG